MAIKKTAPKPAAVVERPYADRHADAVDYLNQEWALTRKRPDNLRADFVARITKDPSANRLSWDTHLIVEASILAQFVQHVDYMSKASEENDSPTPLHVSIGIAAAELTDMLAKGHSYGGMEFECNSTCGLNREHANLARKAARNILSSMYGGCVSLAAHLRKMEAREAARLEAIIGKL